MIVVDTNVIGYLYLTSPHSDLSERALHNDPVWAAPRLWNSELRNVLALYLRKKLLTLQSALAIMDQTEMLMQGFEYEVLSAHVLQLAQVSGCSAYDCEFVALAQDLGVPLVTMDAALLRQFPAIAVPLDVFVAG